MSIDDDIENFLKNGGTITKLPYQEPKKKIKNKKLSSGENKSGFGRTWGSSGDAHFSNSNRGKSWYGK